MYSQYEFLAEKEEMWARMLIEVLEDNHIPCTALPVHGAAFALKTGMQECLKIYVPSHHLQQAQELLHALFSAEMLDENEQQIPPEMD